MSNWNAVFSRSLPYRANNAGVCHIWNLRNSSFTTVVM